MTAFARGIPTTSKKGFGPYFDKFGDCTINYPKQFSKRPFLFPAIHMDGRGTSRSIVVKFALRYGIDVHEFLASKEQAPKVFHFKKPAGDWCVVVMEEIDGKPLTHPVERPVLGNTQAVVENLRSKDFVHGDLRHQNILLLADKSIASYRFRLGRKFWTSKVPTQLEHGQHLA
jgi:hypothetical protein